MNYLVNICAVVVLVCVISIIWDVLCGISGITVIAGLTGMVACCGMVNNFEL